ncbi:molybdate ABC transporter substrate-binding protein [Pedobacter mucosus]|uniref:molybdate ABC transporter substrate-binding protein n=1 Tax=Pedobacter mucosus TaxID=2895286 RepID=UPI001EE461C7|nr:molybdate ABC transporter substrate-binding protein [Pedobacter mucosus]UKT64258.1 molybdate ABC transporter substrate-binding protein [Pedobacter mucosus]
MFNTKSFCIGIFLVILLATNFHSSAQTLRIAVAANAQGLIKKLQADFKKQTGIETESIVGASGKLTAQIMNGAPYDVFLSADTEFPNKLFNAGFGLAKPKIYALGSLIICGSATGDLKNWQILLQSETIKKIAIANPKTAPYGRAAEESLKFYKLDANLKSKLVYGESISQVNTYLQTRTVNIGFTTESFLYENINKSGLKWARVDEKSYGKIEQAVILLSNAKKSGMVNAQKFYDYISSATAKKIIANSGYHLPK